MVLPLKREIAPFREGRSHWDGEEGAPVRMFGAARYTSGAASVPCSTRFQAMYHAIGNAKKTAAAPGTRAGQATSTNITAAKHS